MGDSSGKTAYDAYCEVIGLAYSDKLDWQDLPSVTRLAWSAAAEAVERDLARRVLDAQTIDGDEGPYIVLDLELEDELRGILARKT